MATMRPLLWRLARHARVTTRSPWNSTQHQVSTTVLLNWNNQSATRAFSDKGVNGVNGLNGLNGLNGQDDWDNEDASPFERLLQHSQKFRDKVELDDLPESVEDEILSEELAEENEELRNDEQKDPKRDDDDDLHAALDDHARSCTETRNSHAFRPSSFSSEPPLDRRTMKRLQREIADTADIDFEHGLRDLDEQRAREKLYSQLLASDSDRERVCLNCGELGHIASNCMLPVICSNCGDVGHDRRKCPRRAMSVDQLLATKPKPVKKTKKLKSDKQLKAEARRHEEMRAIRARHERMRRAFLDDVDEFLALDEHQQKTTPKKKGDE